MNGQGAAANTAAVRTISTVSDHESSRLSNCRYKDLQYDLFSYLMSSFYN